MPMALLEDLDNIAGARFSMYPISSITAAIFTRVFSATDSGLRI